MSTGEGPELGRVLPGACYCGGDMQLRWTQKWGGRFFYGCRQWPVTGCKGTISVHQHDGEPVGFAADPVTKQARRMLHKIMDPLWSNAKERSQLYRRLAQTMDLPAAECHVGMFTKRQCAEATVIVAGWTGRTGIEAVREARANRQSPGRPSVGG